MKSPLRQVDHNSAVPAGYRRVVGKQDGLSYDVAEGYRFKWDRDGEQYTAVLDNQPQQTTNQPQQTTNQPQQTTNQPQRTTNQPLKKKKRSRGGGVGCMGILSIVALLALLMAGFGSFATIKVENAIYGCPSLAAHRVELSYKGQDAIDAVQVTINREGQVTVAESIQVAGAEVAHHLLLLGGNVGNICAPVYIDEGYITTGSGTLHGLRVLTGGSFLPFDIPFISSRTKTLLVWSNWSVGNTPSVASLKLVEDINAADSFSQTAPAPATPAPAHKPKH